LLKFNIDNYREKHKNSFYNTRVWSIFNAVVN